MYHVDLTTLTSCIYILQTTNYKLQTSMCDTMYFGFGHISVKSRWNLLKVGPNARELQYLPSYMTIKWSG